MSQQLDLTQEYDSRGRDEKVVSFSEGVGMTVVRTYPVEFQPTSKDLRVFIKFSIENEDVNYSVNTVKPSSVSNGEYAIEDLLQEKGKVTNFYSNPDDLEFSFDDSAKKIINKKTKKSFRVDEFVDLLEKNHLSDRLFWKRKLNHLVNFFMIALFWLSDKSYDKNEIAFQIYDYKQGEKIQSESYRPIEPFFKFFKIAKNLLLLILVLATIYSFCFRESWASGDFDVSNPALILVTFLTLFIAEKFSVWLESKILEFTEPEENMFIERRKNLLEKMHEFQFRNQFNIKMF